MTNTNQPAAKIRYSGLEATIWGNPAKDGNGIRYSVTYSRNYRTADGQWKETTSLSEIDNLKLGHLIPKVTDAIIGLKATDSSDAAVSHADNGGFEG